MSSSRGCSGCGPRLSEALTWIGCGSVFSKSRMPTLALKRSPVRCSVWLPVAFDMGMGVMRGSGESHQREVAFEFHQVLTAVDHQGGAGERLVLEREPHRGRHVSGCGRAAQRREPVALGEGRVVQQMAGE